MSTRITRSRAPAVSAAEGGPSSRPLESDAPINLPTSPTPIPSNDGGDGGDEPEGNEPSDSDGDNDEGLPAPPFANPAQNEFGQLLQALRSLRPNTAPKQKAKLREPDPFDGSDSRKLRTFLALCQLNFRSHSSAFPKDEAKVNYALSYLKGTALEWFEPSITDGYNEPWMDDWDAFVQELRVNFGPADPTADAEEGLDSLRMSDKMHIAKYNVEFNKLAALVAWGDAPLRHAYYKGLPDRIKDALVNVPKAKSLQELRVASQQVDIRYWERRSEKNRNQSDGNNRSDHYDRHGKTDKSADKSDSHRTSDHRDKKSHNGFKKSSHAGNTSHSGSGNGSGSSGRPSGSQQKAPDLSDKLGKDGKLTSQERQQRFDNNLCMFCGRSGHVAKECPKSSSSSAKARAAKVADSKN